MNTYFWSWIISQYLHITDPPNVTSLTVNRREVHHTHVINEGEEIDISCLFEEGNPPTKFILVDKAGKEVSASRGEQHLNHSLNVQCQDDWPTIVCEGFGSIKNRSVTFLVRCK